MQVLADANILVKDMVSYVLFDLGKAKPIDLRWTPQIEVEYAKHRVRLRAQMNQRELAVEDLIWAQRRLESIKKYLVPNYPPGMASRRQALGCTAKQFGICAPVAIA